MYKNVNPAVMGTSARSWGCKTVPEKPGALLYLSLVLWLDTDSTVDDGVMTWETHESGVQSLVREHR